MAELIVDGVVQAAGCVVWRDSPDPDPLEVLIVHRPRYDDWTFPKGKLEPGERPAEAAVREVQEETGYDVELGGELARVEYVDHLRRPKAVHYFTAVAISGDFAPNDEVDGLAWVPVDDAFARLSYERDVVVARQFAAWLDSRPEVV